MAIEAALDALRMPAQQPLLTPLSQVNPAEPTVEKTALTEGLTIADNGTTANGELWITGSGPGTITGQGNLFDVNFRVVPSAPLGARDTNAFSYVALRNSADALADDDGDGMTNGQEFLAGTDPLDAASALRLQVVGREAGGWRFSFGSVAGENYRLKVVP